MIVLGTDSDDKGRQLEALTGSLLRALGYVEVVSNQIAPGGEEIDVRAQYPLPGLGGTARVTVICECKAYRSPLGTTHWLKFLGKVFTEDARNGAPTRASLIALAGVNGNVAGSFEDLRRRRPDIEIVSGDRLLTTVREVFRLCSAETALATVAAYTSRDVRGYDVVYYDGTAYWVALLAGDAVAVLDRAAAPVGGEVLDRLRPLLAEALPAGAAIDLREEAEAQRIALLTEKLVLAKLFIAGGRIAREEVGPGADLAPDVLRHAVEALLARGWVAEDADAGLLALSDVQAPSGESLEAPDPFARLMAIDRFFLSGPVPTIVVDALWSDYHTACADERYTARLVDLQGGIPLTPEETSEVRQILTWSPSALQWILEPDAILVGPEVQHAGEAGEPVAGVIPPAFHASVVPTRRNYLFRTLYNHLARDCRRVALRPRFHDVLDVREVHVSSRITLKSGTGVLLSREVDDRTALGKLEEGLVGPDGSPYIVMLPLHDAPEPWEPLPRHSTDGASKGANDGTLGSTPPSVTNGTTDGGADP